MSYKNVERCTYKLTLISMQLATLIGTVLATALMLQLKVPSTYASTQAPPELCRLPAVCATRSPRVCGRDANGMCRRFNNICEMLEINRRDVSSSRKQTWTHTPERDCRRVRGVGVRHAYWCHQDCPRRPVACRRTSSSHEICVRSRNHRVCKILANRCQLLNNNCHARPRNNWLPADRRRCGQMQLGDKPNACLPLPTTRKPEVTIRPILPPTPEISTTTELPKTSTRRSTPGNGTTTVG